MTDDRAERPAAEPVPDRPSPGAVDEHGRPEPPPAGDEVATLLGFLDFHRATLAWKTRGLDAAALRATLAPSPMTLGGMLGHLAYVEDSWLSETLFDEPVEPWRSTDWAADLDADWHLVGELGPDRLHALWQQAVDRSRRQVARALADGGLDRLAARAERDGARRSLRWILVHLVEEYARHNGHADLIRESVDGLVGE